MLHDGRARTTAHWIGAADAKQPSHPRLGVWVTAPAPECRADLPEIFILYSHGLGETRAYPPATERAHMLSAPPFCATFVAYDYRGFGDVPGIPSEHGVVDDAERAWRWACARQPAALGILFGHSLGTAVTVQLAARLRQRRGRQDGQQCAKTRDGAAEEETLAEARGPAAVILESAFSSIADIAASFVPWPHRLHAFIHRRVIFRFESASHARNLTYYGHARDAPPAATRLGASGATAAADSTHYATVAAPLPPQLPPPLPPPLRLLQLHAQEDSLVDLSIGRRLFRALPADVQARWLDAPAPATHDAVLVADAAMQRAVVQMIDALRVEVAVARPPS